MGENKSAFKTGDHAEDGSLIGKNFVIRRRSGFIGSLAIKVNPQSPKTFPNASYQPVLFESDEWLRRNDVGNRVK